MSTSLIEGDIKFVEGLNSLEPADIEVFEAQLILDNGLENYVLISLQTDARADDQDILPAGIKTKKGWWGNQILDTNIGSKLWLLQRAKLDANLLIRAKQYCQEALQWMIDENVVDELIINVTKDTSRTNSIFIEIDLIKEENDSIGFAYYYNWRNQAFLRT